GEIDVTYTGGNEPVNIIWSNGSTDEDLEYLSEGTYSITITDQYGCTATQSATVVNNSAGFAISSVIVSDENCGDGTGAIDLTITGGITPYTFQWNTGATTEDLNNLSEGYYSCNITDGNNCVITVDEIIDNVTTGIAVTGAITQNDYCDNGVAYIDLLVQGGTTPYSYMWNSGETTEDLAGINEGMYVCTVTDNSGCEVVSDTIYITNTVSNVTATHSITTDMCGNASGGVNITASGGYLPYSYNWSNGATTEDLNGVLSGNYSVTVTDATGCEFYNNYTVPYVVDNNLHFASIAITDDNCGQNLGQISFQPQVAGSYIYELDGTPSVTGQPLFSNLGEGIYTISIIENLCSIDTTLIVQNITTFTSMINNVVNENCGDGTGSADIYINPPSTGYSYVWSNGTYNQDPDNLHAGIYTCEITDTAGCHDLITLEILNNAGFTVDVATSDEYCSDGNGSIDLTVNGASGIVTFTWSSGPATEDISGLNQGSYSCTVTDDTGCEVVVNGIVDNNTGTLSMIAGVYDDFCNESQGYVGIQVSGGTGPYIYLWNTGGTADTLYNLQAGTYSATITDSGTGCMMTGTWTVGNSTWFTVNEAISNATCSTCPDGAIDLIISGSSPGYYFNWNNSATTEDINGLLPGIYSVTVTDSWGCSTEETYTVGSTSYSLALSPFITDDACNDSTGYIQLNITGGSGSYTFFWSNGATSQDNNNLPAGTYDVTVTDQFYGTTATGSYTITNTGGLYTVSSGVTDATCYTCPDGSIDLTVTGPGLYSYLWSNGDTTEDVTGLLTGLYTVTITDEFGCTTVVTDSVGYFTVIALSFDGAGSIKAYPVPTRDMLYIEYSFINPAETKIRITDITGKLVMERSLQDAKGTAEFDLSGCMPGVYLVNAERNSSIAHARIIVSQ
ncbi:MAG: T9SS type A sorting domain-containing protein, partial [Bacteroidota bacterium]